ncbi:hypothetical protein H2248_005570 [Termitomyces sp. 'cryptogamus']|nr:hypothetical protein H2248_005570 [Termitomyces sp. 'cryptogamus']
MSLDDVNSVGINVRILQDALEKRSLSRRMWMGNRVGASALIDFNTTDYARCTITDHCRLQRQTSVSARRLHSLLLVNNHQLLY